MNIASILITTFFSGIGFVAFIYGKKQSLIKPMLLGAALMGFPYLVEGLWLQLAIGATLTVLLFIPS